MGTTRSTVRITRSAPDPVLPYTVGAHPGLSGQFSILQFTHSSPAAGVVYLDRFTSDLYLYKPSDVQHYSVLYDHLQARALDPGSSRAFITDVTKMHIDAASRP
ncbi:Scr1 family TA system antitoxin-like transcriptional regulator [Streptomyces sp. ISL-100]|uniref:Scr1 family TA system antitoxin-like transcriptional regulator n=1 Tax=Streptomyces sp. ISL-100 TaxID=2819173 RepID=UPI0027E515E0|nr:Scr1 family TA system antitoxin-like transcriptional regulator [Streptomyces sp. ISL-100]